VFLKAGGLHDYLSLYIYIISFGHTHDKYMNGGACLDFLFLYVNLIRILLIVIILLHLYRHEYKKAAPAAVTLLFTFLPWLLGLVNIQINTLTEILYPVILLMAVYLGAGCKYYDRFPWWDRVIHFFSGILFFSFGMSLAGKSPGVGLTGTLIFCFSFSLALHEIWEVLEFLTDSIFHTDHQHWQKHSTVVNHQPEKAIQPPGLTDTMIDTISGIIGAAAACAGWWIVLVR